MQETTSLKILAVDVSRGILFVSPSDTGPEIYQMRSSDMPVYIETVANGLAHRFMTYKPEQILPFLSEHVSLGLNATIDMTAYSVGDDGATITRDPKIPDVLRIWENDPSPAMGEKSP